MTHALLSKNPKVKSQMVVQNRCKTTVDHSTVLQHKGLLLKCLLHMSQVAFASGPAESTVKARKLRAKWGPSIQTIKTWTAHMEANNISQNIISR